MNLRKISGPELSAVDLQMVLRLRAEVFVVEQQSCYLDVDGLDLEPGTTHYLMTEDGVLLGYARVLTEHGGERRIGRVVTAKDARGSGLGYLVMAAAVDDLNGASSVLESQVYAQGFYARFGYAAEGAEYIEDGIPHITMRRAARSG